MVTRGLRFRLTLAYVLFFALLLAFLGLLFRQTLHSLHDQQLHDILNEEWGALRGYLRIERPKGRNAPSEINWYYDRSDPEEALIVDRLRQVYLLADANGRELEVGPRYRRLGVEAPDEIRDSLARRETRWHVRQDSDGTPYLIRSGPLIAEDGKPYYVAIGRSYADGMRLVEEFTWYYSWILPAMIGAAAILGWFVAGRALRPVNDIADTAQRITGSNLAVRIPTRGADDELDRLTEAFNRMTERLDQSFRQTRQFSADVSHELRTPLTAIRGQLEVALLTAKTTEEYRESIATALEDVERLTQTIRALLLLSQAESGQLTLQKHPLDLAAIAADVTDQFGIPAESAGVLLVTNSAAPLMIEADRIQIERLLSNLISNAIKYTREGGTVTVSVGEDGDEVTIGIDDTGIGISPDHLPFIFDRFYRVPDRDQSTSPERGLGLGLSFVAWIVKAHGGRIDVRSESGKGTSFLVRLPKGSLPAPETNVAA